MPKSKDVLSEREKFEKWATSAGFTLFSHGKWYFHATTRAALSAWEARAALPDVQPDQSAVIAENEACAKLIDAKHEELAARSYPPPRILLELSASIRARHK